MVSPLPTPHPSAGLPGPARPLVLTYLPGQRLLLGATWCLRLLGALGCLRWGRGPVSRLGLVCHKELLRPMVSVKSGSPEAQIGASKAPAPAGRGDRPGPGWSRLKALLCVVCSCSACGSQAVGVGSGPAPFPPPCPLSHRRGALRERTPGYDMQEAEGNFQCDC